MSNISLTANFELDDTLKSSNSYDAIVIEYFQKALEKHFDKVSFHENNPLHFTCLLKTKIVNPCVSLKVVLHTKYHGNKVKVLIDVFTKPNGWFWFAIIISIVLTIIYPWLVFLYFLIDYLLYSYQKRISINNLNQAFKKFKFMVEKI